MIWARAGLVVHCFGNKGRLIKCFFQSAIFGQRDWTKNKYIE